MRQLSIAACIIVGALLFTEFLGSALEERAIVSDQSSASHKAAADLPDREVVPGRGSEGF
jgi:hypothetical protein